MGKKRNSKVSSSGVVPSRGMLLLAKVRHGVAKQLRIVLSTTTHRGQHQWRGDTQPDRYPEIFAFVAEELRRAGMADGRVLSFGCSTGEECVSVLDWLPRARVVGVDISRASLRAARRATHGRVEILHSQDLSVGPNTRFSAVFAMSVLCRHPESMGRTDISRLYPFQLFEETCGLLVDLLRPGGLLVIYNANYDIRETRWAHLLDAVSIPRAYPAQFVEVFAADGRPKPAGERPLSVVFRRRETDTPSRSAPATER